MSLLQHRLQQSRVASSLLCRRHPGTSQCFIVTDGHRTDTRTDTTAPQTLLTRRLQLNPSKTDLMCMSDSSTQLQSIPPSIINISNQTTDKVRNLGVQFDCEVNVRAHIAKTTQTCFFHLRRLRQIRRLLGRDWLPNLSQLCSFAD